MVEWFLARSGGALILFIISMLLALALRYLYPVMRARCCRRRVLSISGRSVPCEGMDRPKSRGSRSPSADVDGRAGPRSWVASVTKPARCGRSGHCRSASGRVSSSSMSTAATRTPHLRRRPPPRGAARRRDQRGDGVGRGSTALGALVPQVVGFDPVGDSADTLALMTYLAGPPVVRTVDGERLAAPLHDFTQARSRVTSDRCTTDRAGARQRSGVGA